MQFFPFVILFIKSRSISRILCLFTKALIIYLGLMLPITSIDLPSNIGRAVLHALVYLVFQLVRFTLPTTITCGAVMLLPRHFTLTFVAKGGIFSVVLAVLQNFGFASLPVRKYDALCCSDFPLVLSYK